jgi:hypothetical protein
MDVAEQLPLPWLRSAPPQTTEQKRVERAVLRVYDSAPAQDPTDIELSDYYAAAGTRLRSEMMRTHLGVLVVSRGRSLANSILWPHAVSMKVAGGIPYALAWAFHMIILTFFAVGCAVAPRRLDTALLLSLPAYSLLLHAVVIPLHRYHFPVMPVVTVIAAIGLDALVSRLRSSCDTRSEYRTEHAATT